MPFAPDPLQRQRGYKVKGLTTLVNQGFTYRYDPESGIYYRDQNWEGTSKAIDSFSSQLARNKTSHSADTQHGTGRLTVSTPLSNYLDTLEVRYELVSEFIEKDSFSHPTISAAALAYDANIDSETELTWRAEVEAAVQNGYPDGSFDAVFDSQVKLLRNGITGYENENLVIRRYRKAPGTNPLGWRVSILDGKYIYTTAQLGLPDDLAWNLPDITDEAQFPVSIAGETKWGWRRRPTSNVWTREFIEQSSEFVLAEWALLYYREATGSANW